MEAKAYTQAYCVLQMLSEEEKKKSERKVMLYRFNKADYESTANSAA